MAARIVLQVPRRFHTKPLLHQLHWLPVQQRITYKFWHTKFGARPLRSIYTAELQNALAAGLYVLPPFPCWTNRSWEQTSPSVLSGLQHRLSGTSFFSLPQAVLISDSLSVFTSRLKPSLFNQAFTEHWSDLPTSASEVTIVWRYRNSIIIVIILTYWMGVRFCL